MSGKVLVSIPKHLRSQIDGLVEQGTVSTISEAVRRGLSLLVRQERLQRWDDEVFVEYDASLLKKDPGSGVLISRQFQIDLNGLAKKTGELRKEARLTFKRLVHYFYPNKQTSVLSDKSLEIKQLELKGYFFADFEFRKNRLRILLRRQGEELIACQIGYTTELL